MTRMIRLVLVILALVGTANVANAQIYVQVRSSNNETIQPWEFEKGVVSIARWQQPKGVYGVPGEWKAAFEALDCTQSEPWGSTRPGCLSSSGETLVMADSQGGLLEQDEKLLVEVELPGYETGRAYAYNGQVFVYLNPSSLRAWTWVNRSGKYLQVFHSIENRSGQDVNVMYRTQMSAAGSTSKEFNTSGRSGSFTVRAGSYVSWMEPWYYPTWSNEIPQGSPIEVKLELLNPRRAGYLLGESKGSTPNEPYYGGYGAEPGFVSNVMPQATQAALQKWLAKR